jgi:TatD DNase family protein
MDFPLVDIGLNLAHDSFDADRDAVVAAAIDAGVRHMVVTGSSLESSRRAIEIAAAAPGMFRATVGVHPHHAREFADGQVDALERLTASPVVGAVGECGLDYFRNFSSHEDQERVFHQQLALAGRVRKPVFLHQRDAHGPFVSILREHVTTLTGGVAHCFTGDRRELDDCLDLGLSIGITGWICDERRGTHLRELVQRIPLDRLMAETDAPYLLPRDLDPRPRSRRNEPRYLPHVVRTIARYRRESLADVAAATTANALAFFGFERPVT